MQGRGREARWKIGTGFPIQQPAKAMSATSLALSHPCSSVVNSLRLCDLFLLED